MAKGETYTCQTCHISVTVAKECAEEGKCDIVCCGKPMVEEKTGAKAGK